MTQRTSAAGFTLIELMISIGIFAVFLAIITGVFSRFVESQRHNIAQSALIADVQSGLESFAKEVRTGYGSTYFVFDDASGIAFINQAGVCVIYRVENGVLERAETEEDASGCSQDASVGATFVPLTSNQTVMHIKEDKLGISVDVAEEDGGRLANQGSVTISITARSARSDVAPVSVRRTITSRQFAAYNPGNL